MADNIELPSGSGGSIVATDDDGTAHHQYVKLEFGADNTQTKVSSANPLPVIAASNSGVDIGDVTINNAAGSSGVPVQGGAATDAAVAGNPLLAGARASAAAPTDMSADGDAVPLWATLKGALNVADGGGTLSVDDGGSTVSIDDGGGSLTVDGTVAVSGTVTVDASGAAVPVTDNGGSLTVDNGGTFAVQATMAAAASSPPKAEDSASANADVGIPAMAVQKATPANTAGTDGDYEFLQMSAGRLWTSSTIDSALPAGTNAIGKLAANSGVDIGDVDVASVIPGTGATNLGKAEDAAHSTGDVGVMALSVRKDTGAATAGTDGDYQPLITDSSGNLYVNVAAGGTSGTQYTEDAASAADPTGNALIMVRADTPSATTSTDGDNIAARGTNKGELYVKHIDAIPVTDNGGNISIDDGGNSITVDGSVTVSGTVTANPASGTIDTVTTVGTVSAFGVSTTGPMKKEDVASADGDAGMAMLAVRKNTPANTSGTDGDYEFLQMSAGRLWASATIDAALPAGTNAIGKLAANSGVDIGDVDVTSISAGTNAIGNVGLIGRTTGGMSIFKSIDIDETEEEVKATAGQVFSISAFNHTAAPLYLKFYNLTAANTTVGTSTPVLTFTVPGNADSDGAGFVWNNEIGFAFGTAISVACTGAIADNDTTAPAANACSVMIGYV